MAQSSTMMRCQRCKAAISAADASARIRHGLACMYCGAPLVLHSAPAASIPAGDEAGISPEHRLLDVLQQAAARPVSPHALAEAGIHDPANAIFQLERAGYRIERTYAQAPDGGRRFVGYRLYRDTRHY
jgi:DNA-directed RNA polymerase subunit RPC12/RpoP